MDDSIKFYAEPAAKNWTIPPWHLKHKSLCYLSESIFTAFVCRGKQVQFYPTARTFPSSLNDKLLASGTISITATGAPFSPFPPIFQMRSNLQKSKLIISFPCYENTSSESGQIWKV